jgi:hypothetical protein
MYYEIYTYYPSLFEGVKLPFSYSLRWYGSKRSILSIQDGTSYLRLCYTT